MPHRIQSPVSAGSKSKKGAAVQAVGTNDVGPGTPTPGTMLAAHVQADFSTVAGGGKAGGAIPAKAGTPLQGHLAVAALETRGNSAKRGPGKKSPSRATDIT